MNFISKNLGWILLFVFFLFMLFIISANQGEDDKNLEAFSWSQESQTGEINDIPSDLDNLLDKINQSEDAQEDVIDIDFTQSVSEENISEEVSLDIPNKKSFFDIFRRWNIEENKTQEQEIDPEKNDWEIEEDNRENNSEIVWDIVQESVEYWLNLMKGSEIVQPTDSLTYNLSSKVSTWSFETAVGKRFTIDVYSLKLNNKYFNQALAYMMKWDIVEQVSEENIYGCFQVEIISSLHISNNGKIGYVCKKYLAPVQENGVSFETINDNRITTWIGSYYEVSLLDGGVFIWDLNHEKIFLDSGDILKQSTSYDYASGCISMLVVWAANSYNLWKNISVCDISKVSAIIE